MPISEQEQAQLDALHDQMVEESMHRECWNCHMKRIQDEASEWQCATCGAWNDCEES
jgi:lipopolysaccharide biosynthesis regulator YciM